MISPALLRRIPDEVESNCGQLMRTLRKVATPFPFLGMPPEVRNRIYKMLMPREWTVRALCYPERSKLPLILAVATQIKKEALPVFYAGTTFVMRIDARQDYHEDDLTANNALRKWFKSTVAENAKHLKSMVLWITRGCKVLFKVRDGELKLTFVGDKYNRKTPCQERLNSVVGPIQHFGQILDLQGEMMIQALFINWDIWGELTEDLKLRELIYGYYETESEEDEGSQDENED